MNLFGKRYYMKYNLAFYTYFIGTDSNPAFMIPPLSSKSYPCYFFTNNHTILNELKNTKWISVFINKQTDDDVIESNMIGKHVKVLPHEFEELKNYDYLCYFDTKLLKVNIKFIELCINKYFIHDNQALLLRKNQWNKDTGCLKNELKRAFKQPRYQLQKKQYQSYIQNQVNKGLLIKHPPGFQCNFLIRNMTHPKMKDFNKTWYEHIQQCGIQDQIPFHFVKQLFPGIIFPLKCKWEKLTPKYFDK